MTEQKSAILKKARAHAIGIAIAAAFIGPIEKETLQEIAIGIFEANDAVMAHGDGRYPPREQQKEITLSLDAH